MEESGTPTPQHRSRFWFGFSAGLLTGIIIAVAFYFTDKMMNDPVKILVTEPQSAEAIVSADTLATAESEPINKKKGDTREKMEQFSDTLIAIVEDTLESVDFTMEESEDNGEVMQAKGVAIRKVRVINNNSSINPEHPVFEVEQWTEYVKNRYSYQRAGNVLKLKGIDIHNIAIVFTESGEYLLEYNGRQYPIPENNDFSRL